MTRCDDEECIKSPQHLFVVPLILTGNFDLALDKHGNYHFVLCNCCVISKSFKFLHLETITTLST